jgi:hypothetical protein
METLIVYPKDHAELVALKAFLKVMRISFENTYSAQFVEKVLQGRIDIKSGKGVKINIDKLWLNFEDDK